MSSIIKKIQGVNFSQYYIKKTLEGLEKVIYYLKEITNEYKKINEEKIISFPLDLSKKFYTETNEYLIWFKDIDKSNKENYITQFEKYYESLREIFEKYYEKISSSYKNIHFKNISEYNENISKIINDLSEFDPPIINNESDSLLKFDDEQFEDQISDIFYQNSSESKAENFYGSFANTKIEDNKNIIKCYIDLENEGVYYCSHCDYIFCKDCGNKILENKEANNHKLTEIDYIIAQNEKDKEKFLKSFLSLFKDYLIKCNFILNNKNINLINNKDIIKPFQYPTLKDNPDIEDQKEFLQKINDAFKNLEEKIKTTENKIKDKEELNSVMTHFLETEFEISLNNIEEDDIFSDGAGVEGEEDDEKSNNEKDVYDKIKNKFIYIVNLINKDNYNFDNNKLNQEIIEKMSKVLSVDKKNITILSNNKRVFINNFIKTNLFSQLKPKEIRQNYQNLPKLYYYKLLIDGLIRFTCKIPVKYLDFRYNFITPNLSLNNIRGTEIYNPPYGWYGIGLNVTGKYDNGNNNWLNIVDSKSKWANCYYFFSKYLSSDDILIKLNNAIIKNELYKDDKFQIKMNVFNKRIKDKKMEKIGTGYYLSNDINIAEKYTGIISFRKKKYKILLMAKVLIESIKEPDDGSFWIISEKDNIRIYRILLKEIYC